MIRRLQRLLRQLGLLNALLYLCGQSLSALTGQRWRLIKYLLVAQPVPAAPLAGMRGKHIQVRHWRHASQADPALPRPPHTVAERFTQRAHGFVAYCHGQVAGCLWLCLGHYQEDEVRARFVLGRPDAAWDFDVHVLPEYRAGLAFARLWDAAGQWMVRRRIGWSCSRINAFNPASLSAHGRLGARRLGWIVFLCCGSWQWTLASLSPYVHLSRSPRAFPRFRLETPCPISPP